MAYVLDERTVSMKLLSGRTLWSAGFAGLMMTAMPAFAQQAAEPAGIEGQQLVCDLTGDCGDTAEPATSAPDPAKKARTGKQRGFSFDRQTAEGQTASATSVTAPAKALVKPAQVGAANMGLTFLTGSAVLTEGAKQRLARYAVALNSTKLAGRRLRIEGHTDASGNASKNQTLSQQRAQSVADFLVRAGVPATRLDVVGKGSSSPLPGTDPQAAANRRVMAVLL
jgi:OOP family OmpA-OmpF porin